ncbi:uncharacterized protein LOC144098186 [Amblyomma americanum]
MPGGSSRRGLEHLTTWVTVLRSEHPAKQAIAAGHAASVSPFEAPRALRELSGLYASCYTAHFVERDLHDALYAFLQDVGVSVRAWLRGPAEKLLAQAASLSLQRAIPSVLWLRQNPASGLLSVEPARPLFSLLPECTGHDERQQLTQQVVGAIDEVTDNVDELAHELAHTHAVLTTKFVPRDEVVPLTMRKAFHFMNASQLLAWLRVFQRHLPHQTKQDLGPESVALFRNVQLLANVTSFALLPESASGTSLERLFVLSTLLEPVFEWEYRRHSVLSSSLNSSLSVVEHCAQTVREVLPTAWTQFATRALVQDRSDLAALRRMAHALFEGVRDLYQARVTWHTALGKVDVLDHLAAVRWRLPDERHYDADEPVGSAFATAEEFSTYLARLASLRLLSRWKDDELLCGEETSAGLACLAPELATVRYDYERNTLWVTPGALVQPLFYSGAEPLINLATLGAMLAYEFWSALCRHAPELQPHGAVSSFDDEVSCFVSAYRAITNDTTPSKFVAAEIYSRLMALRTVLDAARHSFSPGRRSTGRWPDVGETQLLFVRYCSLFCSRHRFGLRRAAQCDLPVASTPEFGRLFRCGRLDPLATVANDCQVV